ncbi:hypothetical protein [Erythrobacter aureus]|uniref:Uncharacterized protein n=1 Tax=Erythrobacter aureus TaxID=2182384 RepID=A0A345YDP0_9SPHN|nr:hypothetical protein [Erythrobacter aureus]AXK42042.1 hypothetical protein DVR09_06530 [Erythrobacter aureus]
MANGARILPSAIALLLFVCAFLIGNALSLLHQGEDQYWFGKLVVWSGRAAILACVTSALLAYFSRKAAQWTSWAALVLASPIAIVTIFPNAWCVFLQCSGAYWEIAPLQWAGMLLLLPQVLALIILAWLARL